MRTSVVALFVALLAGLLAGLLLAPQASAVPAGNTESVPVSVGADSKDDRSLWDGDSAAQLRTVAPCTANLGNIHASVHAPGRMNVTFKVNCNVQLETLHIWAQLWEDRWWGWDRIGVRGSKTRHNVRKATVHANDRCRNNETRATAGGWGILNGVYHEGPSRTKYADNPCNL